ncbi:hypothetical protein J2Y48_004720 [Mycoplana sp. BE70]|nr:hypothetical protein [Mycoplana sp. BE70]MDR6759404.1 hypothetical protein [Mycoplana sp. BE70]
MFSETLRLTYLNTRALALTLLHDEVLGQWALILSLVFIAWVTLLMTAS